MSIIESIKSIFNGNNPAAAQGYETFDELDNPSTRCPVMVLLDTSGSMEGEPIAELNEGIRRFIEEVQADETARFAVELGCVTFGGTAEIECPLTIVAAIHQSHIPDFKASGATPMGAAVKLGLDLLEERKREMKDNGIPYHQPWMVLMTDGAPTDDTAAGAARVRQLAADRKLVFFGIGLGANADLDALAMVCPENRPPKRLKGLEFGAFFEWLSASVGAVAKSRPGEKVPLPETNGWEEV